MRKAFYYPAGTTFDETPVILDDGTPGPSMIEPGVTGIEAPEWTIQADRSPGADAAEFVQAVIGIRSVKLPVYMSARNRAELKAFCRMLIDAMDPEAGPGKLALADLWGSPDGDWRWISAIYAGGLEGDEGAMKLGNNSPWWRVMVEFQCLDPFWYSMEKVTASWTAQVGAPYINPFSINPFQLAQSGLIVAKPLVVVGDGRGWPTWQLAAPFVRFKAIKRSTGETFSISRGWDLSEQSVTVVTRPSGMAVLADDGTSAYAQFSGREFSLTRGDQVDIEVDGQRAATAVDLEMDEAWKTGP